MQLLAPPLVRGAELLEPLGQPLDLRGELLGLVLGAVGLRVRAFLGVPAPGEGGGVRVGVGVVEVEVEAVVVVMVVAVVTVRVWVWVRVRR